MTNNPQNQHDHQAAQVIRDKLMRIYDEEPSALKELGEAEAAPRRSKHQQFIFELNNSGKDLATIQTEWHRYYQNLPPAEQQAVWDEFYASQPAATGGAASHPQTLAQHKHQAASPPTHRQHRKSQSKRPKLSAKHHVQSLLFGLGMGFIAMFILLFGFFNEFFIAPFIQPSRATASTPIIIGSDAVAPTATPEVIIPKINVEIPVDYNQNTTDESIIEGALQNGVVHYPTTTKPGELGNAAFFGHSSNNIFNKGKYKFAFVLLHTLVPGDTFYLTYNSKVYVYKVVSRQIVDPSNVGVLGPVPGQTATATLITCDPPGTSLKRLVVVGQQISPDPSGNTQAATPAVNSTSPSNLPGNGPTLLGRALKSVLGKVVIIGVLAIGLFWMIRWINKPLRR